MNKLLIALLTLSITGNVYLLLQHTNIEVVESLPKKVIVKETKVVFEEKYKEKYLAATLEIRDLKKLLELKSGNEKKINTTAEQINNAFEAEFKSMLQKQAEHGEAKFHQEKIHPQWAGNVSSAFNELISTQADRDKYNFRDIECKSTTCRMVITPYFADGKNNQSLAQEATVAFRPSLSDKMPNFGTSYKLDKNTGDVVVYFWQSEK